MFNSFNDRTKIMVELSLRKYRNEGGSVCRGEAEVDSVVEHQEADIPNGIDLIVGDNVDFVVEHQKADIPNDIDLIVVDNVDSVVEHQEANVRNNIKDAPTRQKKIDKIKEAQKNRLEGKSYISFKREGTKVVGNCEKNGRSIKKRCGHAETIAKTSRTFLCGTISENKRSQLFKTFWDLKEWKQKQAYIKALVTSRVALRRRKESSNKKAKLEAHDIVMENDSGKNIRVCRKFLLNTLDIKENCFRRWTSRLDEVIDNPTISAKPCEFLKSKICEKKKMLENKRTGVTKPKKRQENEKKTQALDEWLESVPKVPSHYCRASTKRTYVEAIMKSWSHMHKLYMAWCRDAAKPYFGREHFTKVLKTEKKISIHLPRKDRCDTCVEFDEGNLSKEIYEAHINKKNESREAKRLLVSEASDKKLVITMDLQSVLLAPKTNASSMYYKHKLQVHDFTVYEINSKDVYLYVWNETDGGVSSNEFTSCIIHYLTSKLQMGFEEVVLISDGCNYQNRNRILASALRDFSFKHKIIVQQFFLEKGHTQMEADSVHSTLEGYFYPPIHGPSDYICRMRLARDRQPYNINVLHFDFFLNYGLLPTTLKSIKPPGAAKVVDIRQIKYLPSGDILYNLNYGSDFSPLLLRNNRVGEIIPPNLYESKIPLSSFKYKSLQELKPVIDRDFHSFYDNLPYKN